MMRTLSSILLTCLVAVAFTVPGISQSQYTLDDVLERMIEAGNQLQTLEAHVERDTVTVIVDDHALSSGQIYFAARGSASEIRMNLPEPAGQELLVVEGKVQLYSPRTNQVQEYDLAERGDIVEFLVVGFGPANASLQDKFEVVFVDEEDLQGIATSVIDLTPRSEEVLRNFRNLRLWVDQERWMPIQLRLDQPGGNHQMVKYSEIQINSGFSDSVFELDLPDDVQILR